MNKYLLLIFTLLSFTHYGQSLSKTRILYESNNQIVMNNGKQYQILTEKPFYEVSDATIKKHLQVENDLLRLNRVLVLRSDNKYTKLIEWLKEDIRYYEYKEMDGFTINKNNISNTH